MKAITCLHPRKTQHHVHNCLHLISCCGAKWCIMRTYALLLSTITSNMLFKESDISCMVERFFLGFLQIPLKSWTPLAKPFPLFTAGLALDDAGPSTSIGSTKFTEGSHWESTNSLLSVESSDPSVYSFGISPLVQNVFFPVATVPSNMISMDLTFGKGLFLKVNALGHGYMWTTGS